MRGIVAWFARNPVAANLLMFLIGVGGLLSIPRLQQKTFPDVDIDVISVAVPYLGAAPEEVEQGVCIRIEEEIHGLNGIEKLTSSAAEGACGVSAELLPGYPVDRALSEIKNAVDSITTFPVETEKPIVSHVEIRRTALRIAVSANASERALKTWGERIRDSIAALPGITQVELYNARDDEISIEVSEESLRRHALTFDAVVAAVRRGSLDRPGGSLKTVSGEILLRTKGQAYVARDFESIVVRTDPDGTRLHLHDVANVVDGFDEDDRHARFDGDPAVTIKVYRVGEQKVLEIVDRVKTHLETLEAQLPEGLSITVWEDSAQTLRDRLTILYSNGFSGFLLVFGVLALFLRFQIALWVALGVPLSILGALLCFPAFDISIDVISLFAFIMALGLLVDDAIVVGENVHRLQEENPEALLEASVQGTSEVTVPVIFGVLTTVAAFAPLIFAPGGMGQVFSVIGISAVLCLVFSVVESQLILPAHLGHMKTARSPDSLRPGSFAARWARFQGRTSDWLQRLATDRYKPLLERALAERYSVVAASTGILLLSVATVFVGIGPAKMNFSFFPPIESDYVTASIVMPQGTPVEATRRAAETLLASAARMQKKLDAEGLEVDGESLVKHVFLSVGEQPMSAGSGTAPGPTNAASGSHVAEVSIEIQSGDRRPISAAEIKQRWRDETPPIPDVVELTFNADLFNAGDPIDIQLASQDIDQLEAAADQLETKLLDYAGVFDVADSFRAGKQEIVLDILPAAESLGLSLDDLSRQVRQAFYGEEAQRVQRGREDVRVMIRYPRDARRSLADLESMRIRTPEGGEVPFSTVARAELGRGFSTIKRADRQRVVNVTADVDAKQVAAGDVIADLERGFMQQLVANHPGLSYSLEGEQAEQAEAFGGLLINFGIALLVIYALMAIPLRSYMQPLIIMGVIPFGFVGAILGHWFMYFARELFTDQSFNFSMMSIFGIVALAGVVVNSGLVLVHYVNERREAGIPLEQAVHEAGVARFRPIALTTFTTFAGLVPILRETSVSAQFLIPMATSLAFGVIVGSFVSLILVPAAYLVLEDLQRWIERRGATTPQSISSATSSSASG